MRREYDRDPSHGKDSMIKDVLALLAILASAGCGYYTAGPAAQLSQNVKTDAVRAFKNETLPYRIEQSLTAAVVQEFTTRTRYRIVSDSADADATLHGTVLSTVASPLTYDTATGRAASVLGAGSQ